MLSNIFKFSKNLGFQICIFIAPVVVESQGIVWVFDIKKLGYFLEALWFFESTVNGHSNKKRKEKKAGASSGHITNLKQSILDTFDINGLSTLAEIYKSVLWYETMTKSSGSS